jgi:hypothetical protein
MSTQVPNPVGCAALEMLRALKAADWHQAVWVEDASDA